MAADSSWGEVRWHEPQSNQPPHDSTMATRTLLAENRTLATDGREEQHARVMEPYHRIDHGLHMPQANTYNRGPANRLDDTRSFSESNYISGYSQKQLHGQPNTTITYPLGSVDGARTLSISDQIDRSRRTSELQSNSNARASNGRLFILSSLTIGIPDQLSLRYHFMG
jgi:hypothetical protein